MGGRRHNRHCSVTTEGPMRYLAVTCAFAAGLVCGVGGSKLVMRPQTGFSSVEPKTEVVSILEDEVMSIAFRTDKMTLVAQRSKPGEIFAVQVTYVDGQPPQQCKVSSNLAGQLANYATITAKRQLQSRSQAQTDFPTKIGTLELRDRMEDEASAVIQLRASSDGKAVAALYENIAVEVSNPESAFANLEKGCHFLIERNTP